MDIQTEGAVPSVGLEAEPEGCIQLWSELERSCRALLQGAGKGDKRASALGEEALVCSQGLSPGEGVVRAPPGLRLLLCPEQSALLLTTSDDRTLGCREEAGPP